MTKGLAIVEDNACLRQSLVSLFAGQSEFELGPVCASGEEFLEHLACQHPGEMLVLVDLGLPGMSGQQLIAQLARRYPQLVCVAHTIFEEKESVFTALRAGAVGYLLKGSTGASLLRSLASLEEGGAPLTPRIARLLVGEYQNDQRDPLTEREREVLAHLAAGHTYKETASRLVVSVHTVHTHVKRLYEKMQVRGRQQAVEKARREGWLTSFTADS